MFPRYLHLKDTETNIVINVWKIDRNDEAGGWKSICTKLRLMRAREPKNILISHFQIILYLAISRSLERDSHIFPIRFNESD